MEFTEVQKEALFQAKLLYPKEGFVPVEEAVSECEELVEPGWLRTETQEKGDVSYYWTQQAESALNLHNLTDVEDRKN